MTTARLTVHKKYAHVISDYDDSFDHADDTATFEFHDCKYTNIEWFLDEPARKTLSDQKIAYDIEAEATNDGEAYTQHVRYNAAGERIEKTVNASETVIPISELENARYKAAFNGLEIPQAIDFSINHSTVCPPIPTPKSTTPDERSG